MFKSATSAIATSLRRFAGDSSGATAIEYALICALIAVALISVLGKLGNSLSSEFAEVSGVLK
jgi:pilus assembly protein Flp/PilA